MKKETDPRQMDLLGIVERLQGPREWGFIDPEKGTFVADSAPHDALSEILALQARIDKLMLEHCHGEMTTAQLATWGAAQVAVDEAALIGADLLEGSGHE